MIGMTTIEATPMVGVRRVPTAQGTAPPGRYPAAGPGRASSVRDGRGEPWPRARVPRLSERAREAMRVRHFSPRTEGAAPVDRGDILINGTPAEIRSPADAISHRIGLLTEDRKGQGLFLEMAVKWNLVFPIVKQLSKFGVVDTKKEDAIASKYKERINIKTPSLMQQVINLSGGNQQKVVLAKSLAEESVILIFDEPTRGIDVGAKQEIYHLMTELADNGIAILMISSDMEELLGMADRIIVLCESEMAGEVQKDKFNQSYNTAGDPDKGQALYQERC